MSNNDKRAMVRLFPDEEVTALGTMPHNPQLTSRAQKMTDEARIHQLVMEFHELKGRLGDTYIANMHIHLTKQYRRASDAIFAETYNAGVSREQQEKLDEFRDRQLQHLAKQLFGIADAAAANIYLQVEREIYLMDEPQRKSFLQRLFGG